MADVGDRIFLGAEADVRREVFLQGGVVSKRRVPKSYRHPALDERIRRERTRLEAALLAEARAAGVPVPAVLDVDLADGAIRMTEVGGRRLRDVLAENGPNAAALCRKFGRTVARLHAAGLIHGDLTTSNVHVVDDELVLLDFGLASRGSDVEERGVDLHLVERTFESTHPGRPEFFQAFRAGYEEGYPQARAAMERMFDIKSRARYA